MSRAKVVWAPSARDDLRRIISFIASDPPLNAMAVFERIEARVRSLQTLPRRGRRVPELEWQGITSYLQVTEPPWRVIYRVEGRRVLVVAVVDGRRSLEDALLARLLR